MKRSRPLTRIGTLSTILLSALTGLSGCGEDGPPAATGSETTASTGLARDGWLVRWGDFSVGPWTTDQLLADCARGRFSAQALAWNPERTDWTPLGELFPSASFGGSVEDGRRWSRVIDRMNDSHDADQSDAFWSEFFAATGQATATPFVPTRQRGPKLQAWRTRVRPLIDEAIAQRGRFGPEDILDGKGVSMTEAIRSALALDASDAIARGDEESALQALVCLATLGRQMSHGLFGTYSEEGRTLDRTIGDESLTWQDHEDLNLRQGIAPLANINGVLGTWKDWRTTPRAEERLASALDWVELDQVERLHRLQSAESTGNEQAGWTAEDRTRRHRELVLLIESLRDR